MFGRRHEPQSRWRFQLGELLYTGSWAIGCYRFGTGHAPTFAGRFCGACGAGVLKEITPQSRCTVDCLMAVDIH